LGTLALGFRGHISLNSDIHSVLILRATTRMLVVVNLFGLPTLQRTVMSKRELLEDIYKLAATAMQCLTSPNEGVLRVTHLPENSPA
jgi:hypothetical protein